jgi:ADP-ribose pyrophosphatase YjhB (NUDIX family)
MSTRRALLRLYRALPRRARRFVVRRGVPLYQVGAMCVIERADGALLLVRDAYRRGWGFPGGLLKRGERPVDAVRREIREEIGLDVEVDDRPVVLVDAAARRVDIVYRGRPRHDGERGSGMVVPRSAEIVEVRWFPSGDLPDLQDEATAALVELGRSRRPPPAAG